MRARTFLNKGPILGMNCAITLNSILLPPQYSLYYIKYKSPPVKVKTDGGDNYNMPEICF
jgi:hypothetical protein